jgi:hypothetical protein
MPRSRTYTPKQRTGHLAWLPDAFSYLLLLPFLSPSTPFPISSYSLSYLLLLPFLSPPLANISVHSRFLSQSLPSKNSNLLFPPSLG